MKSQLRSKNHAWLSAWILLLWLLPGLVITGCGGGGGQATSSSSGPTSPSPTPAPSPTPTPTASSVAISPTNINLPPGGTQQFTGIATGASNPAVTWSATAGSITSAGLYTAPSTAGTPTVTATSISDPTLSATAHVQVGGTGSALAQAAAQVTPGTWLHFTAAENSSWNAGALLQTQAVNSTDNMTAWSSKGLWNPVTKEFYFLGGANCGNGNCPQSTGVLKYNDSSNTWSVQYNQSVGHTYEAVALDTTSGSNDIYLRVFASNNVDLYSIPLQSWNGGIAAVPGSLPGSNPSCCLALEYFPDRDSLITIDNQNGIYEYTFSDEKWSSCLFGTAGNVGCPNGTNNFCSPTSADAPWARYDAANHRMLVGGCTNVYSLSTNLVLTSLAPSPFNISTGTIASPITVDPGSGKLVSWDTSGTTYTSDGTSWVSSGASPFSNPVTGGLACTPVSTYNVIMCLYAGTNATPVTHGTVWLFRAP